jgi:large repetitive protein
MRRNSFLSIDLKAYSHKSSGESIARHECRQPGSSRIKRTLPFTARFRAVTGLGLTALLLAGTGALAQTTFAPENVGTMSAAQNVTVTARATGTVHTVEVLTMGVAGLDFAAGGASACGSAKFTSLPASCTQSVTFKPTAPGVRMGAVVLLDAGGHLLGTTYLAGTGLGPLGVFVPADLYTVAGVYRQYSSSQDGIPALQADLDQPYSVAVDGAGNLYIAESGHDRIRKVTASTGLISTLVGNGSAEYSGDNGPASKATLNTPTSVTLDGAGNVYIADTGNNAIRKVTAATGIITTIAGNGTPGFGGDNGPARSAVLDSPMGVTVDAGGNIYIADTANQRIRKITLSTGKIDTVAGDGFLSGDGTGGYSGDNGPATSAELNQPYAVAVDSAGDMYIPDSGNNRIRKVSTSGTITTYAGDGLAGFGGDNGPATSAYLKQPSGVVVDPAGNLYIADTENSAIRKVSSKTNEIISVAVTGLGVTLAPGSQDPLDVTLYAPAGMGIDSKGDVFVADYLNMLIKEMQSNLAILDYEANPVRQDDVSAPQDQIVENDGTAALDITNLAHDANSEVDRAGTTCHLGSPFLAVNSSCVVAAEFAPTVAGDPLFANIDLEGDTANAPLDIELAGDATSTDSTTVSLSSSPNPSRWGEAVTFSVVVTSGKGTGTPTGTITFMDGAKILGIPVGLNASALAIYTTTTLAVGTHTITAVYSGDKVHLASTSAPITQVVNEPTATLLTSSLNPSPVGSRVTFTVTVDAPAGGGVLPDGSVALEDGDTLLASVALHASGSKGVGAYSTATLAPGVHRITAIYPGNATQYLLASTSGVLDQNVQEASTTTLDSNNNPSAFGTSVTFTATVASSGSVAPAGQVEFEDAGKVIGAGQLAGNPAIAKFTTSTLAVGTHPIIASFAGSAGVGASESAVVDQKVTLGETSTSITATPNPGTAGKPVAITATVKLLKGPTVPTGEITFTDTFSGTSAILGTVGLTTAGTATIDPILAAGTHSIVASYAGNSNDGGSESQPLSVVISLGGGSVSLLVTPNPVVVLSPVTFVATVSGNGVTPTGTVNFVSGNSSIGKVTLNSAGTATLSYSNLGVGKHEITAEYSGDKNNAANDSATITETVQAIPTVTALGSSSASSKEVILVATVVGAVGPAPTGKVTFNSGATVIGSVTVDANGSATLTPNLATGTYNIVANYGGDSLHLPSSSKPVTVGGSPAGYGITLDPSSVTVQTKQSATITVSLASTNGFSDTIGLGCGSVPAAVTCHFSSDSIGLTANGKQSVQLTIDTGYPLSGGTPTTSSSGSSSGVSLAGLLLPISSLFGFVFWRFRRRHASMFTIALVLVLSGAAMLVSGCGGFSQVSAAPGKYTMQITGVGQNSDITHYENLTLDVTQ